MSLEIAGSQQGLASIAHYFILIQLFDILLVCYYIFLLFFNTVKFYLDELNDGNINIPIYFAFSLFLILILCC